MPYLLWDNIYKRDLPSVISTYHQNKGRTHHNCRPSKKEKMQIEWPELCSRSRIQQSSSGFAGKTGSGRRHNEEMSKGIERGNPFSESKIALRGNTAWGAGWGQCYVLLCASGCGCCLVLEGEPNILFFF